MMNQHSEDTVGVDEDEGVDDMYDQTFSIAKLRIALVRDISCQARSFSLQW